MDMDQIYQIFVNINKSINKPSCSCVNQQKLYILIKALFDNG